MAVSTSSTKFALHNWGVLFGMPKKHSRNLPRTAKNHIEKAAVNIAVMVTTNLLTAVVCFDFDFDFFFFSTLLQSEILPNNNIKCLFAYIIASAITSIG